MMKIQNLIITINSKISEREFIAGLILFGILLYARCFGFEITRLDDMAHLNHPGFPKLWQQDYLHMYIPLFYQYLAFMKSVFGNHLSEALHAGSLLLHILNTLLVYKLCRTVFPDHRAAARIGTLLFLLHPLQIEVVAWVSQARESLSVGFALASLLLFLKFLQKNRWVLFLSSLLLFAFGLLAKPGVVVLPLLMLLFAIRSNSEKANILKQLKIVSPYVALSILFSIVQSRLQRPSHMIFVSELWQRPLIALDSLGFYIAKIVWPTNLSADYGLSPSYLLSQSFMIPQLIALAMMGIGLWVFRKQVREYRIYLLAALFALVPVLGFVPFRFQDHSTVADHYLYLSSAFLFPWVGLWVASSGRLVKTIFSIWVPALVVLNFSSQSMWTNTQSAAAAGLAVNPNSEMLYSALGDHFAFEEKYAEAIEPYLKANAISPRNVNVLTNLSVSLFKLGRKSEAQLVAKELLLRDPGNIQAIEIINLTNPQ